MDILTHLFEVAAFQIFHNKVIELVILAVIFDTIFGCIRAIREHKFNSCFGIDGAIRKTGMMLSMTFFTLFDTVCHLDLMQFVPEEIIGTVGLTSVGSTEFFALLYISYETVSVLKNMFLCGLPTKGVLLKVYNFLKKFTTELPDIEEVGTDAE